MPAENTCAQCASPLPANAPLGLCPACLIRAGLNAFSAGKQPSKPRPSERKTKAHTTVGDYELLEEIARGGMGIVFRARQVSLNRIVAVKALLFGEFASDHFITRFRAEAQAAAALQHPNIIAIHEIWEHRGQHFFSMELVDGQTLAQIIKDRPISSRHAAQYATTIARAVHFANSRGILHRDLKPSNVLIDHHDQPRITDFGLAKRLDQHASQSISGVVGSPHYMSPEQAGQRSAELALATDVYSIGAMLYHMLAGRPPFAGESVEEVIHQTLHAEPISPRLLNTSVPRDLETICLKCLQKEPRRRYASARELADDLERFLQDVPIQARPISRAERTLRWCRRNPAPTALLSVISAVAIAATWTAFHFQDLNQAIRISQYVSDMTVAMRHANDGDYGHTLTLLKAHTPANKKHDIRGFEWRYMWTLCRGNFDSWLPRHPQVVGAIHFTSDGEKALAYCWNNSIRLTDTRTRANLLTLPDVTALGGFTPNERAIVVARTNALLEIIDIKTGSVFQSFPNVGQLLAYSPTSQIVATLDPQQNLKIWNVATGHELLTIPDAPSAKLDYSWNSSIVISRDGRKLAMIVASKLIGSSTTVGVWDLTTGKELDSFLENRELRCAAFSPDANFLLTGDGAGSVSARNLSNGVCTKFQAHTVPVLAIAFSPDGKSFATGSSDEKCIRLWDLETLSPKENQFLGQAGDVWTLSFSADGKRLASGTRDDIIRIWNVAAASSPSTLDRLHADQYANIAFSPNSRLFAGGCEDHTVKIWNVNTLAVVATIPRANFVVAFSSDNRRLLVSGPQWNAFWWDIEKRTAEFLPTYSGQQGGVNSVAISPDRRFAALGMSNGDILIVDMNTGLLARPALKGHTDSVRSLAFSPDGAKLASGSSDKNVMVWDVKTGASLGACSEHKGSVFGLTISPDGQTLASGCGAETIKLWDLNNVGKRSWASGSQHRSAIRSLSFSPDNRTLASGSEDSTVKLWNFPAASRFKSESAKSKLSQEVASFPFKAPIRSVLFSPDGNTLAVVTDNGGLQLFRAFSLEECDRQLAEFR
jgi:WD40 repeat protein/serine/threonine protein kinase